MIVFLIKFNDRYFIYFKIYMSEDSYQQLQELYGGDEIEEIMGCLMIIKI